jgi:arylsulfatase
VSGHTSTFLFRPNFAKNPKQWQKSWPYLLQQAGYFVGHVGKWQYRDSDGYMKKNFNWSEYFEGWLVTKVNGETYHIADKAEASAIRFLRERPKGQPFATTIAFYPPKGISFVKDAKQKFLDLYQNVTHDEPYDRAMAYRLLPPHIQNNKTEARERYMYRFERHGTYQEALKSQYAAISHLDHVSGQVIEELKRQGVYNRTMIIVTAGTISTIAAPGNNFCYNSHVRTFLL